MLFILLYYLLSPFRCVIKCMPCTKCSYGVGESSKNCGKLINCLICILCECLKIVHKYNNCLVIILIGFDKNRYFLHACYLFLDCILNHIETALSKCWHLPDLSSTFYAHGYLNSWLFQFLDAHDKFAFLFWNIPSRSRSGNICNAIFITQAETLVLVCQVFLHWLDPLIARCQCKSILTITFYCTNKDKGNKLIFLNELSLHL